MLLGSKTLPWIVPTAFLPTGSPKSLQHQGHTIAPSHRSWNSSLEFPGYEGIPYFQLNAPAQAAPGTDPLRNRHSKYKRWRYSHQIVRHAVWIEVHQTRNILWFPAPSTADAAPGGLAACLCFQKGLFQSKKCPCAIWACLNTTPVQHACNTAVSVKPNCWVFDQKPVGSYAPKIACAGGYSSCRNASNPLLAIQQHYIADYKGNHSSHPNPHSNGELCSFFWIERVS